MIKLYSYFRSSAAYRVRIALNLKNIPYEYMPVHLVKNGGEQNSSNYKALNPLKLVPTLVDGSVVLSQSLAIIEYLEEAYPEAVPLLPNAVQQRAQIRALSQIIACDIHPLNNLRVLRYLDQQLEVSDSDRSRWYAHWVRVGFDAYEQLARENQGKFCIGDSPSMADCCLIPQIYNAKRFNLDLSAYPNILEIYSHCESLPAFIKAEPEKQPDAT